MLARPLHFFIIGLLLGTSACRSGDAPTATANDVQTAAASEVADQVGLTITTASGANHRFKVDLAVDPESQEHGLMGRTSLPDDGGMLFPFAYPQAASFWMKNTPLPLDLLFVRPDGTIAGILQGKPNDLHPLSVGEGIAAVLEIAGGRSSVLGVKAGDRVQWGDCSGPAPAAGAWRADRFCPH